MYRGTSNTALCHCTDCQKWSGAGYTSNIVVPRSSFSVTKDDRISLQHTPTHLTQAHPGKPKEFALKGDSRKLNNHFFCSNCGSSLYTELRVMPDLTCVKSGGLDGGANDHPIAVEFYTKGSLSYSKAVWAGGGLVRRRLLRVISSK